MQKLITLLVVLVLLSYAGPVRAAAEPADPPMVDNPQYKSWAGCKVGAIAKYRIAIVFDVPNLPKGAPNPPSKHTVTVTLKEMTPEKAVVEIATSFDSQGSPGQSQGRFGGAPSASGESQVASTQALDIPAKAEAAMVGQPSEVSNVMTLHNMTKKSEGDEEVAVGGRRFKAHWIIWEASDTDRKQATKMWYSTEVPNGVLKSVSQTTSPMNITISPGPGTAGSNQNAVSVTSTGTMELVECTKPDKVMPNPTAAKPAAGTSLPPATTSRPAAASPDKTPASSSLHPSVLSPSSRPFSAVPAEKALEQIVQKVELNHIEFQSALNWLTQTCRMNVMVKWKELAAAAIEPTTLLSSVAMTNVKSAQVLRAILEDVGGTATRLDYEIDDGVIVISTREDLDKHTVIKTYNIQPLITRMVETNKRNNTVMTGAEIVERIKESITSAIPELQPGSEYNSIKELNGQLVVKCCARIHAQIAELLKQLNAGK